MRRKYLRLIVWATAIEQICASYFRLHLITASPPTAQSVRWMFRPGMIEETVWVRALEVFFWPLHNRSLSRLR